MRSFSAWLGQRCCRRSNKNCSTTLQTGQSLPSWCFSSHMASELRLGCFRHTCLGGPHVILLARSFACLVAERIKGDNATVGVADVSIQSDKVQLPCASPMPLPHTVLPASESFNVQTTTRTGGPDFKTESVSLRSMLHCRRRSRALFPCCSGGAAAAARARGAVCLPQLHGGRQHAAAARRRAGAARSRGAHGRSAVVPLNVSCTTTLPLQRCMAMDRTLRWQGAAQVLLAAAERIAGQPSCHIVSVV